ncbi:MAG: TetR/AcrR family transcriptional regulator [bacterium]|nr:TetR/AcrR family transcriptional regulator [bacterium]
MRISKDPEVRKQEMIDTAMHLFARNGYEGTSMSDIAKEMKVVPGLCYRYFKSKEELYHTALHNYAVESCKPMIAIMKQEFDTAEEYMKCLSERFLQIDGKEKYHEFFHREGSEIFHSQLEYEMLVILSPYMIRLIERLNEKEQFHLKDCKATALFLLHGQMPIINDNTLTAKEKIAILTELISKLFN